MKKIIKLTESDLQKIVKKVLREQRAVPSALKGQRGDDVTQIQQALVDKGYSLGTSGPLKNGVDGIFGSRTEKALKQFQTSMKLSPTGVVDQQTRNYLYAGTTRGMLRLPQQQPKKTDQTKKTDQKMSGTTKSTDDRCIALSEKECARISPTKEVAISSGKETRCSAYMVKCLSQYDKELFAGNAWDAFNNVKKGGTVKYNAYTSGEVNWKNVWSELAKNKISRDTCEKHASTDDADGKVKSKVPEIVNNNVPKSVNLSLSTLKLGDIVGLYHRDSDNKGMAFCQRVLKRGLDDNGNVYDKDPFTFNSHVGFVGAIKDGVPIIIHNVHGTHLATPATKMLNKNSEDMIMWVVSDSDIESAVNPEMKKNKGIWDYFS